MNDKSPEKKDKSALIIRNVVYAIALFAAAVSIVTLFINFIHLMLFTPTSIEIEEWAAFHFTTAALFIVSSILTAAGVAFAVLSLKIKKLRFASIFVLAGIAVILIIFSIAHVGAAVGYIVGERPEVEYPLYAGSSAVSYTAGFAAAVLQPAVCFIAMAVCALFKHLSDRKERAALQAEIGDGNSSPAANNETATENAQKICPSCGTKSDSDDNFCMKCGTKLE